jgi:hypothetical protein
MLSHLLMASGAPKNNAAMRGPVPERPGRAD